MGVVFSVPYTPETLRLKEVTSTYKNYSFRHLLGYSCHISCQTDKAVFLQGLTVPSWSWDKDCPAPEWVWEVPHRDCRREDANSGVLHLQEPVLFLIPLSPVLPHPQSSCILVRVVFHFWVLLSSIVPLILFFPQWLSVALLRSQPPWAVNFPGLK